MKMYQKFMAAAAMAVALASCGAGKQATIADLGGEWVITSADGNTLNAETTPFIGINAADGISFAAAARLQQSCRHSRQEPETRNG